MTRTTQDATEAVTPAGPLTGYNAFERLHRAELLAHAAKRRAQRHAAKRPTKRTAAAVTA